jgi:antitoxin component of RelBE/YafQ-DinJ toxin-antitoxin module
LFHAKFIKVKLASKSIMPETSTIIISIETKLKLAVEDLLQEQGLTEEQAITLFYQQIVIGHNLPFQINQLTLKTFRDTDLGRNLVSCSNIKDMFQKLEI